MMSGQAVGFADFLAQHDVRVRVVDKFAGFTVDVALPRNWEAFDTFDATGGARMWAWRNDPRRNVFCANAVLILQQFDKALYPEQVFAAMCERQRQSVPGCRELRRNLSASAEGLGSDGSLALEIDHEVGVIDSLTHARIVAADKQTLIAQLTVTALHDSPVELPHIRLSLVADDGCGDIAIQTHRGGAPTTAPVRQS